MVKHHSTYSGVREGTIWLDYREFPWLTAHKPKTRGRMNMEKRVAKALREGHGMQLTKKDVEEYGPPFLEQRKKDELLHTRIARMTHYLFAILNELELAESRNDLETTVATVLELVKLAVTDEQAIELAKKGEGRGVLGDDEYHKRK